MPGVLKRYDAATQKWVPAVGSTQAQPGLLAIKSYNPTTGVVLQTTTSFADIDATNVAITFMVPSSGAVTVQFDVDGYANGSSMNYRLAEGGVAVEGTETEILYSSAANTVRLSYKVLITGLTPGVSKTYTLQHKGNSTASATRYGGASNGPVVVEVRDAQTSAGVLQPAFTPMTQAEYDALEAPDPNTLYVIVD